MPDERLEIPQNLRRAGSLIVASVYALRGFRVSWPLEPAPYDLLAEEPRGEGLLRVQVKTCTSKQAGNWVCWITRSMYAPVPGGKRRIGYDVADVDVLGVVDGELNAYLIPFALVAGQTAVTLMAYSRFRVGSVNLCDVRTDQTPTRPIGSAAAPPE